MSRQTLTYLTGRRRFNCRVAGIAIREGHVLTCREDDDAYVLLPGGRVEFGEASAAAMAREVEEELRSPAHVGPLLFAVENFFAREGEDFHEIGYYYRLDLPARFPFSPDGVCLETMDEGHVLSFAWVETTVPALAKSNLLPLWLRSRLADLPEACEHLVIDEREHG